MWLISVCGTDLCRNRYNNVLFSSVTDDLWDKNQFRSSFIADFSCSGPVLFFSQQVLTDNGSLSSWTHHIKMEMDSGGAWFFTGDYTPTNTDQTTTNSDQKEQQWHCERRQRRGKRAGIWTRLDTAPHRPAIPRVFITNTRSLVNNMDNIKDRLSLAGWTAA